MSKLQQIIDDAVELVETEINLDEPYPEDHVFEIADQAVPIYTYDILNLVPELHGYELSDPGLLPENPDIERIAAMMIFEQVSNACHQRLYELEKEWDEIQEAWEEAEEEYEVVLEARQIVDQAAERWYDDNFLSVWNSSPNSDFLLRTALA